MNYREPELEIIKLSPDNIVVTSGLNDNPSVDEDQDGGVTLQSIMW